MRKIAFVLAVIMLATVLFSACDELADSAVFDSVLEQVQGEQKEEAATTTTAQTTTATEEEKKPSEKVEEEVEKDEANKDPEGEKDPEGPGKEDGGATEPQEPSYPQIPAFSVQKEIRIMVPNEGCEEVSFGREEDVVSSAMANREKKVTEQLNLTIRMDATGFYMQNYNDNLDLYYADVMSGAGKYDLILGGSIFFREAMISGCLSDMMALANQFDEPLPLADWVVPQALLSDMTLNGKLYALTGPFSYSYLQNLPVLFCNSEKLDQLNYGYHDLAEKAMNGEWDVELFCRIMSEGYVSNVCCGIRLSYEDQGTLAGAMGLKISQKNEKDLLVDNLGQESNSVVLELLGSLKKQKIMVAVNGDSEKTMYLSEGSTIFTMGGLGAMSAELAQYEGRYGVLPLPKMSATDAYASVLDSKTLYYGISVVSDEKQETVAMLALLAVYGTEVADVLLLKNMQSEDSYRVAQTILETARVEYTNWSDSRYSISLRDLTYQVLTENKAFETLKTTLSKSLERHLDAMNAPSLL